MPVKKRLRCEHNTMRMEAMEPRMLLSADLLALAGLPGVDNDDDDAPWDQLPSDPADLVAENDGDTTLPPAPLELAIFNGVDQQNDSENSEDNSLLALLSDTEPNSTTSQMLFVDTRVPEYGSLIDQIRQTHPSDELQIYLIDPGQDGVSQLTAALAEHTGIESLHVISHGNAEGVQLGSTWLSNENIDDYADQLGQWSQSLTGNADLLLYGCDLAADAEGKALVDAIAALTGTDVAASDDLTGHTTKGGDWNLEYQAGAIETATFTSSQLQNWQGTLATFTVNDNSDTIDTSLGDGNALDGSSNTTLRAAIMEANALGGSHTINLGAGTYNLTITGTGENAAATGDLDITADITITGAGADSTIIDGKDIDRVFDMRSGTVSFSGLTIQNGTADLGGGIDTQSATNLTLEGVRLTANTATDGGGAIYTRGVLNLDGVLVDNNTATNNGGGIRFSNSSSGTILNSTFSGNQAGGSGGALHIFNAPVDIVNSTIAFNEAASSGGGINTAGGATQTLLNSILSDNTGGNFSGSLTSLGYNIDSDGTAGISNTGDQSGMVTSPIDVKLGALQDNGGTIHTHALLYGSPAIDTGDNGSAPATDQRGISRPQDGDGDLTDTVDIGAFESTSNILVVDTTSNASDAPDATTIANLLANVGLDGKISLQEAIEATNGTVNLLTPDEIHFQITDALVGGAHTIAVGAGGLRAITEAVIIDGTTDADYAGSPVIELNGASAGTDGLSITGDGATVRGLAINRFSGDGIEITGDNNRVELSYIGTSVDGSGDLGNSQLGIRIANATGNYIGGSGIGNVISGNGFAGIAIVGSGSNNNFIQGNLIGVNAAGTGAIGNDDYGIDIWSGGPSNNTIGGATSDLRNIISGNGWAGIHISGTSATGNQVLGNYIGTDITGTAGIANGTGAISGGIDIDSGADNNIIGGAGTGNLIAYNTGPGVRVDGSGTSGNAIRENEIHSNTGIGIDQVSSGNQGRQDPSLSSVVTDGAGSVSVGGSYSDSATAGQTLTIEYFSNPGNDREGKIYLDSDTFVTDGSGNATISSEISATVSAGEYVTATVTDASGNTSEFSVAQAAVANGPPTADSGGPYTISEGGTLTLDASASSDADGSITAWDWDIGDNGSFEKSGETISYNWADLNSAGINDDGSFDVALRVTDNNGATDTQVFTLNVDNTAPTLSVSGAVSADEDTAYSFDLIFTDPGSETLTWFVNWGDGTLTNHAATGNTTSVSHVYQDWNNGFTRNITVSASDEDGAYTLSDLLATGIGNGYGNGASDGIFRFDGVTGSFISAFDDPAQISDPIELIMGPDGKYYVSGYNSDNILRFNADGSYFDEFVSPNLGGLISPTGIAFGPSGKLYVASEGTNEILRYYANGSFDKVFGTSGGGMDEPGGITFGPDGDLYATSWNSSEIYMYDGTDGGLPTLVIGSGLSGPEQIYFDADGDLFIADTSNDRIARYDGLSLTTFTSGTAPVKSGGLVVGPDGSWYAASRTGDSVLKYDAAGNFDSVFVSTGEGGLNGPLYLAFTPAHQVLVNPVNDEPTLTATGGDPTFTEDGAAAGLFSGAIVDTIESGQTLKGLTLTVTNVNDGSNEILNIDGSAIALTNGNSGATASLNYNVNVSVTGTGTTATVVLSGGTLSTAATQTLVDGLSYQNNSNDPNTSNRVVTLTELVDSGGTANSGDDTAALSVASTVTVQKANDAPTLANNTLTLNQGQTITLDSSMLSATDVDTTNSNLTFTVSGVSNGHFAYGLTPATPITSFTQAQVIAGDVVFVHDGGELAPAFDVTVADAEPLSDGPISATINFSGTNAGVLWLSTVGDESGAHGVPGLDASGWQDSDVLQQANPNLSFGEADTDGTFSIAFDASNFAINPAVNGIHYVASDVTVGATNPIDLQAGDLLLTTQNTKTFTSNGAGAPGSLSVNKEDIFYFRPDTPGDYSSGNFYMLLTDPFGGSKEIRGLTLVEKDVWLGDYWLREGDLLLSRAGAAEENDIWVMKTDTLNTQFEGSYQGLQQVLIEGDDAGVDLEDKIYGLDVLEVATTIGGKSYNSGTILVSIDADDTDGIGSTSQQATPNDIVALTINRTNLGSGASLAQVDASLMFDGDDVSNNDVNFDSNNEEIDGLTLTSAPVASNATPTLGNNALTLNEGETVTVTTTMLSATDADNVDSGLVFNLSVVSGGQFELTGDPGNAVTSFTQQQISDSELVFIDNGDESAPTFNVSVSDGSAATTPVAGVVNFTNVNDEPSLTATSSNPTFTEGGSATSLFSGTSVDTVESGQTLTGLTLTVTNLNDGANEILNIDGAAIALTNGNSGSTTNLSYSVVVSGTDATVTLTGGTLSTAATQTLVDAISYQNNSNDPDTSDRVVTLTELVDSGGTANSGDDTAALSITSTVTVNTQNDAPTFSLFNNALGTTDEDTEVEITLATMKIVGDEADTDGSVDGFVVKSISSGSLRIGTDAASATAWNVTTNATIDATNKGYWTAAAHANGILNAFVAAAVDNAGGESSGSATGQVIVSAVNDAPTGSSAINGAATEQVTLSADNSAISDNDGLGAFSYQWLRDSVAVNGATSATYELDDIDIGGRMSVRIDYVDGEGTAESLTSAQTAVVTGVNDAPVVVHNKLTLSAGDSIILSGAMLAATDEDHANGSLLFTVTSVNGGRFELVSDPNVAITSFTQALVTAGQVRFVDDNDNTAPDFTLQVSDGLTGVSSSATIDFTPTPTPTTVTTGGDISTLTPTPSIDPVVVTLTYDSEVEQEDDDSKEDETSAKAEDEEEVSSEAEEVLTGDTANDELASDTGATVDSNNPQGPGADASNGLQSIINNNALHNPFVKMLLGAIAAPDMTIVPKLLATEIHTVLSASGFLGDLDRIRDTANQGTNLEQQRVASTIAVSTGLSVGYVAWLIRSGVLLSTALSSLPVWHFVDPLPVLGTIATSAKKEDKNEEDDSVESMFKDQPTAADKERLEKKPDATRNAAPKT